MKVFAIFLCMVVGYAHVDSQGSEFDEVDFKSDPNAWQAAFLDDSGTINEDEYIRSKDVPSPASQSSDTSSNETDASEKPSPMTEVKKSGQKIYSGKRVIDRWSLLKGGSYPRISANRHSMDVKRSFPRISDAVRDTADSELAVKTRRLLRTKRQLLKGVEEESPGARSDFLQHKLWLFMHLDDQRPDVKKKEGKVIDSLVKTGTVPTDLLNEYKAAKNEQRRMVKHAAADGFVNSNEVYEAYFKWIRDPINGYVYDDNGFRKKYPSFFDRPSRALDKFVEMKRKEVDSMQAFRDGADPDIYAVPTPNEFEGLPTVDSSEEALFECPKKKRDSGSSVASEMHAQMFVIFLCIVIGIFVVHLQPWLENIGEDELKAEENSMKVKRSFIRTDRIGPAKI